MTNRQPGGQEQMNYKSAPKRKRGEWVQNDLVCSSNNCDCSSGACWLSWFCSPCSFQRNYNRYRYLSGKDEDTDDIYSKYGWCCVFQCFSTGWAHCVLPTIVRGEIRKYRRIEGNPVVDCFSTVCCLPCSLIQEAHEVDSELEEKGINPKHPPK